MDEQVRATIILAAATMVAARLMKPHGYLSPEDSVGMLVETLAEMAKQGLVPEGIQRLPNR